MISSSKKVELLNLWLNTENITLRDLAKTTGLHRNTVKNCIVAFQVNIAELKMEEIEITKENILNYADRIIERKYKTDSRHVLKINEEIKNAIMNFMENEQEGKSYIELSNKFYAEHYKISFSSFYNCARKYRKK